MRHPDVRFDGRVFIITGAGRGIGRADALLMAARGATVVIADNGSDLDGTRPSPEPAGTVVAEIQAAGGTAMEYTADLAREENANDVVAAALAAFGRIDGFIHNASTVPNLTPIGRSPTRDFDLVMRINSYTGFWLARATWPHMAEQRYGRIVYMTSSGIYGAPGTAPYCAAKAAVIGLMRCLALEGADTGIRVNAIAPTARTRMTDRHPSASFREWLGATMPPGMVSVGAAYLMSEECALNGEVLSLGGGRIGRLVLSESDGVMGAGASIEEVRSAIPNVVADTRFSTPKTSNERLTQIGGLFAIPMPPL